MSGSATSARRSSAFAALLGLLAAAALAPAAGAAQAPVTLTAPRDGAVLVPGATAEVGWEPTGAGFAGLAAPVEEWEAFLSVDGGRSYPFRVTPHLDIDISSFRFPVPAAATGDARILLRFGDEKREVGFVMPQRLSISPPGALAALGQMLPRAVVGSGRGEAARPGEPGVVMWVEGSRRGGNLRLRTAAPRGSGWQRASLTALPTIPPLLPPRRESGDAPDPESTGPAERRAATDRIAAPRRAPQPAPILLLIQRSNR